MTLVHYWLLLVSSSESTDEQKGTSHTSTFLGLSEATRSLALPLATGVQGDGKTLLLTPNHPLKTRKHSQKDGTVGRALAMGPGDPSLILEMKRWKRSDCPLITIDSGQYLHYIINNI